jgi:signal transduction histidine kinase
VNARSEGHGQAAWPPLANGFYVVSLGLLGWGIASQAHPGLGGPHLAAAVLLAVAGASWLAWVVLRPTGAVRAAAVVLGTMALTGGALVPFAPLAVIFPAVAALGATMAWRLRAAAVVAVGGWLAMLVSVAADGHPYGVLLAGLAATLAGMIMGITRRQSIEAAEQAAMVGVEKERVEVERGRAELLAERNHLARELHDVLAHTLSALSLQLEAFATVVDAEPGTSSAVREQLERTRTLVHEGLDEARGAVRALRDDTRPLGDELTRLCDEHEATFSTSGTPRPLDPQVSLGLYRMTQEALTNVTKHAPGAPTSVCLGFAPGNVTLTVENGAPARPPAALGRSGGGYGLRGITERLALLGGRVMAGPSSDGWRVAAEVPVA